jgi:acyl-CoA thioesterase
MTVFSELIASDFPIVLTDDWLQGRTAYGGLSAALCVEAARRAVPDLPPLRSAQFTFIGPASGPLSVEAKVLRQGKSAVFVSVDLSGDAGIATHALLSFGVARSSVISRQTLAMPKVKPIGDSESFFTGDRPLINFQRHFESRFAGGARPFSPGADPEYLIWFRHRDEAAREGIVPLVALADAPPPAAMVIFPQPAPISTITWSLDLLSESPTTNDGWWLVRSTAEIAHQGYSTQTMVIWNTDGEPVASARQNVAIFL